MRHMTIKRHRQTCATDVWIFGKPTAINGFDRSLPDSRLLWIRQLFPLSREVSHYLYPSILYFRCVMCVLLELGVLSNHRHRDSNMSLLYGLLQQIIHI